MKKIIYANVLAIVIIASFFLGRSTVFKEGELAVEANGILAYQHYYECAEAALQGNKLAMEELQLAKKELQDYKDKHVMTWPEICDQRDMLSDAIRAYSDHHPESDISEYVSEFTGRSMHELGQWAYAY